jgi:hypothetical protein
MAGTVTTLDTRPFDYSDDLIALAPNVNILPIADRWNFNGTSYLKTGEHMGEEMLRLMKNKRQE